MLKRLTIVALVIAGLQLAAPPARAALLTPTNLDSFNLGTHLDSVYHDITSNVMTADLTSQGGGASHAIGTVTGSVWFNFAANLYTYVLVVDPDASIYAAQFSTAFSLDANRGFTPGVNRVGWSYGDATQAGAVGNPNTAFYALYSLHNGESMILNFTARPTQLASEFWYNNAPITFFIESAFAPMLDSYNLSGSQVGTTLNWAPDPPGTIQPWSPDQPLPTPEPTSLVLLASGFLGGGWWLRRRDAAQRRAEPPAN